MRAEAETVEWTEGSRPQRRADVESIDVDGELVLWDPASRSVHRLDPLGSLFWPFLDGEATLEELAVDAADVWSIQADEALDALCRLSSQLAEARLLTVSAPEARPGNDPYLVDPPSP